LPARPPEAYNWRAAFFMIVPPGICALVCIWFALAEHSKPSAISFDWIGFIALSVAIVAAQLIFDRGQRLYWFDSREITLCAFVGALAFWIFLAHCLTADQPFLNPRLLLDRNSIAGPTGEACKEGGPRAQPTQVRRTCVSSTRLPGVAWG
jgi:MFS transporter, DHA2 family, multidrug resistance protein